MPVRVDIEYQGKLRCRAVHGPSGDAFTTDAPVDNHGRGEAFSPTDLVGTALGTCVLTIAGIVAERDGIDLAGTRVVVLKEMAAAPLRRIAKLAVDIAVPAAKAAAIPEAARRKLERAGDTCPVRASLHPDVEVAIRWIWEM